MGQAIVRTTSRLGRDADARARLARGAWAGARAAAVAALVVVALPGAAAGGGLLTPEAGRATVACQRDVLKAGLVFVAKKLKLLDRCAAAAFDCVHREPGDAACLAKAAGRCAGALEKIAGEEARLAERIAARCGAVDPADLLALAGLGFEIVAPECAGDFGTTLADVDTVATCVVRQHECLAEQLFQTHEPRAEELLALLGLDLGVDSCLEDRGGTGEPIGDAALARPLAKCQAALRKASTAFVAAKLKQVAPCLGALYACAQLEDGDPTCLAKAESRCDKAFAKVERAVLKLGAVVGKRCGALPIGALTEPNGLGADVLVPVCETLGVSGIGSVHDYGNCVVRQHECAVDDLVRFEAPRAAELLASAGRTLPAGFFCPTPIPSATPTPVPTATP